MAKRAKPGEASYTKEATTVDEVANMAELIVPIGELPHGANDRPLRIDIYLTRKQSNGLRRAMRGLRESKETCSTSVGRMRLVDSKEDVVRWLLEQL